MRQAINEKVRNWLNETIPTEQRYLMSYIILSIQEPLFANLAPLELEYNRFSEQERALTIETFFVQIKKSLISSLKGQVEGMSETLEEVVVGLSQRANANQDELGKAYGTLVEEIRLIIHALENETADWS